MTWSGGGWVTGGEFGLGGGGPPQLRRTIWRSVLQVREREEVPMSIVGGLDIHRKQLTFDYVDTDTGEVCRGRVVPADREGLAAWLGRFAGAGEVMFAAEACTGWRYVA